MSWETLNGREKPREESVSGGVSQGVGEGAVSLIQQWLEVEKRENEATWGFSQNVSHWRPKGDGLI